MTSERSTGAPRSRANLSRHAQRDGLVGDTCSLHSCREDLRHERRHSAKQAHEHRLGVPQRQRPALAAQDRRPVVVAPGRRGHPGKQEPTQFVAMGLLAHTIVVVHLTRFYQVCGLKKIREIVRVGPLNDVIAEVTSPANFLSASDESLSHYVRQNQQSTWHYR